MTWDWIRTNVLTPSRLVPLTAQVLTAVVGLAVTWLGTKGWLSLDPVQVVAFVTPLVLGAEASIFKWQQGWQNYEDRRARGQEAVDTNDVHPGDLVPDVGDLTSERAKATEEETLRAEGRHPKGRRK